MFYYATKFNQNLNNWDVSKVNNMSGMFRAAFLFNQDISSWNVSNVTDMSQMFYEATLFNQDISSWNVSSVTNMSNMFFYATNFNNLDTKMNWNCNTLLNAFGFGTYSKLYNGTYNNPGPGNAVRANGISSIETPIYTPP